jgi:hypothetical protein
MAGKTETRRMGRPPVPAEERRQVQFTLLLTEDERAELQREAARRGLSCNAYVRVQTLPRYGAR